MGFGTTQTTGMAWGVPAVSREIGGSPKSNWLKANDDLETANTDALLDLGTSTAYTGVLPVTIPQGATRVWMRCATPADTDTFTTQPVVQLVETDANGIPRRVDNSDENAAGVTLTIDATDEYPTADDLGGVSSFWSDVAGGVDGYDLQGGTTLYMLVETAGNFSGGAVSGIDGYVRFGV
jgi:hypothetical protein